MPIYNAPIRDYQFLIHEFLKLDDHTSLPGFADVSKELSAALLGEGAKLCEEVLFPLNQSADKEGLHYNDGVVTTPKGFKEAYQTYIQSGWTGFTCDPEYGGQGLPESLNLPFMEMVCSANLSFGLTPGLSHGAYNAIKLHANHELKNRYLPKIVSGEWSGVMCLTEPQAGTDLGLVRTRAEPNADGSYAISGGKIFISSGEQDVTENIIHLVLARLPDAPSGIKGISLFLVPKFLVKDDGSLGERNTLKCMGIEHKMGLHASPTCVMQYDGAKGWLVGEPHKGMRAMFTMMNAARLYVGIQGLGIAEVAMQNAYAYAKERLQGRALKGAKLPDRAADPITVHADVRRMLLSMRGFVEGSRALAMETAFMLDLAKRHPDATARQDADDFVQLATPIVKSFLTDGGFETASTAMQVYGGYGYIKDYGVEQYARDARITMIYEGTNGIQAMDLIGRKLPAHTGRYLRQFFHSADAFMNRHKANEAMQPMLKALGKYVGYLQQGTLWMAQKGLANPDDAAAGAVEYQRMFALVWVGFMWARMAVIAAEKLPTASGEDKIFYQSKLDTATFYFAKTLPQALGLLASITAGSESVMQPQM